MHHSDSDADSKLVNVTLSFILPVGDFGTLVKISCKTLNKGDYMLFVNFRRHFWCVFDQFEFHKYHTVVLIVSSILYNLVFDCSFFDMKFLVIWCFLWYSVFWDHNFQQKSQKTWKFENNHDKMFSQKQNNQNLVKKTTEIMTWKMKKNIMEMIKSCVSNLHIYHTKIFFNIKITVIWRWILKQQTKIT